MEEITIELATLLRAEGAAVKGWARPRRLRLDVVGRRAAGVSRKRSAATLRADAFGGCASNEERTRVHEAEIHEALRARAEPRVSRRRIFDGLRFPSTNLRRL